MLSLGLEQQPSSRLSASAIVLFLVCALVHAVNAPTALPYLVQKTARDPRKLACGLDSLTYGGLIRNYQRLVAIFVQQSQHPSFKICQAYPRLSQFSQTVSAMSL